MFAYSAAVALDKFSTFGDLLRYLRRRMGLTQRELSVAVGYSDAQISRLEQNQRLPDLPTVAARFVSALGIEDEPAIVTRLMELAATVRREDAPTGGAPPFKGLLYFDEADADIFFGRESLVAQLHHRLTALLTVGAPRFLAVVGASGSGKSSIVRAGLASALHWNPDSARWPIHILTPTAHPLESLAASLAPQSKSTAGRVTLAEDFARHPRHLHQFVQQTTPRNGAAHFCLVIDQFEELFTQCRSGAEQKAFVDNLLTAANEPNGLLIVVITLRADFYAHCADFPNLREALAHQQEYIGTLNAEELRRTVEEPARRGEWELEPGLVELLMQDIGAVENRQPEPGALPLLSHALLATWERRRGRTLTISGYLASGGVRGAIAETAEAVFRDQFDAQQQAIGRNIFLRLTELGETEIATDTRRRVAFDELVLKPDDAPAIRAVLTALADARLIITEQDTVEVAHEALIREWPTLRGWLEENREGLRLHRHLTETAQEWERQKCDPSELYRGARLAQTLEWAETHKADLNTSEADFLNASNEWARREETEREAQRQRELEAARKLAEAERQRAEEKGRTVTQLHRRALYLTGVFMLALLMAGVAFVFGQQAQQSAVTAQNEQRIAFSRELAAAAISNLDADSERSILLALEAVSVTRSVGLPVPLEAENALHQAVQTSRLELVLRGHQDAIWDVAFSPDGTHIATVSRDRTARIWDATTGQETFILRGHTGLIYSVAYSPDGKRLATAGDDRTVIVWDIATGQQVLTLSGHRGSISCVAFSPDGSRLATASADRTAKIWDAVTGQELLTLSGHTGNLTELVFSLDGSRIATTSDDGTTRIWDVATGTERLAVNGYTSVAFSPDGRTLATGRGKVAKLWDASSGAELLTLSGHADWVLGIVFSPDGTRLATAGYDGRIKTWDAATGRELLSLSGHTGRIFSVVFSPDGKRVATASADGTARLWNVSLTRELLTIPIAGGGGVAVNPDGKRVAAGVGDVGIAKVWDATTGKELLTLSGHTGDVIEVAFSPDGTSLATASADATAKVWDATTGQLLLTLSGHNSAVFDVTFSPDGSRLATAGFDFSVKIWDAATGQLLLNLVSEGVALKVAFSPDGKYLAATYGNGRLAVWDALIGGEPLVLRGHSNEVWDVAFNPDGTRLATASGDGTAKVWETATGKEVLTLLGHTGAVMSIAFTPDGARLATGSLDGTAKVWDAATGRLLMTLLGGLRGINNLAFSPDGSRLFTVGDDDVRVYLLNLDDLMTLAQSRLTRSLTPEECQSYLHREASACAVLAQANPDSLQPVAAPGRFCQVGEVGGQDSPFNQMQYNGLRLVAERFGWEVATLESATLSDYDKHINTFLKSDCDLIVTALFTLSDATRAAAEANPGQKFSISDFAYELPLDNVWATTYATDQAAFLAGYVAASVSKTGKVGTFGGINILPVTDFMDGFALGVAYYNEKNGTNVEVLGWDVQMRQGLFTGNFYYQGDGQRLAEQLIDEGADVILSVAGPIIGRGAAMAVQQRESVYFIGVDVDWTVYAPEFADITLTSIEKRLDTSTAQAAQAVIEGAFVGGTHVGTLEDGSVGIAPFHKLDALVSPAVKAELEQITTDIIAGKIKTKP